MTQCGVATHAPVIVRAVCIAMPETGRPA
jgi:hypothetical protein